MNECYTKIPDRTCPECGEYVYAGICVNCKRECGE